MFLTSKKRQICAPFVEGEVKSDDLRLCRKVMILLRKSYELRPTALPWGATLPACGGRAGANEKTKPAAEQTFAGKNHEPPTVKRSAAHGSDHNKTPTNQTVTRKSPRRGSTALFIGILPDDVHKFALRGHAKFVAIFFCLLYNRQA